jgi:hypothetical protein
MKNTGSTVVSAISYSIAHKILFFSFFGGGVLLGAPFIYLNKKYHIPAFHEIGIFIMLIGVFASIFTAKEIIYRMQEEGTLLYGKATAHTLYGYLRYLCFLPLVGPHIQSLVARKKAKNPFIKSPDNENGA